MKLFRCTYIKKQGLSLMKNTPNVFIEQTIKCSEEKIDIPIYPGFDLLAITEMLPELIIKSNVTNQSKRVD